MYSYTITYATYIYLLFMKTDKKSIIKKSFICPFIHFSYNVFIKNK